MSEAFSPEQACGFATAATGHHVDPAMLRTWRKRGIFIPCSQEGIGWTRYTASDVLGLAVMALGLRAGFGARPAAMLATTVLNVPAAEHPGDDRGEIVLVGKELCDGHASLVAEWYVMPGGVFFSPEGAVLADTMGTTLLIVLPLSAIRHAVNEAINKGASE